MAGYFVPSAITTLIFSRKVSPAALLLLLSLYFTTIQQPVSGFSLKLIHKYSIDSPLYSPNLTQLEISKKLALLSKSRARYFKAKNLNTQQPDFIRPPIVADLGIYLVQLSLGTPPATRLLVLDTGSDLLWIQCRPCLNCYLQVDPIFDPNQSRSYAILPCNHTICKSYDYPCVDGKCNYIYQYADPASSKGHLSSEAFTFLDDNGQKQSIPNLVFGCGHEQTSFYFHKDVDGIMGLGPGSESLPAQLGSTIRSTFMYCLPRFVLGKSVQTDLIFGQQLQGVRIQTIPFLPNEDHTAYYLDLYDISGEFQHFNLPPGTFRDGCVIDTRSSATYIQSAAYLVLSKWLKESYFSKYPSVQRINGSVDHYDLCFTWPQGFESFPWMTFHFQGGAGADLVIKPENMFEMNRDHNYFCLVVMPDEHVCILGSYQQVDHYFSYDLDKRELSFMSALCA